MKKIVLIDDDLGIRETTADILELAGFEVFTSENGRKGIKKVKQIKPDIVLCDINMPDLNGYEVIRILNRIPETANIPFIFLSSNAEKKEIRKGMNLGADDYITKPFKEIDLLDAIEIRIKRSNNLKNVFNRGLEGLNEFIKSDNSLKPLKSIYEKKIRKKFKKNEIIFKEDDYVNFVYFVISGKVKRVKTDSHGKEFLNDLHTKGEFFGYLNFLNGKSEKHQRTAITLETSEIALIPKNNFQKLFKENGDLALLFIKTLSGNVLDKEDRLIQLAYASVRERVANVLINLKKEEKLNKSTVEILKISRDDLANVVGTSKESLIRTLSEFKKENLIETERAVIIILNKKALEKIGNGF